MTRDRPAPSQPAPVWPNPSIPLTATGRPKWLINSSRWVEVPLEMKVISVP